MCHYLVDYTTLIILHTHDFLYGMAILQYHIYRYYGDIQLDSHDLNVLISSMYICIMIIYTYIEYISQ